MTMKKAPILEQGHFLLGSFSSNCSGGMSVTKLPERWSASWEDNKKLALLLDDAGIDFMLPIARWITYGGETKFQGSILETMTWATALAAITKNITLFATIQTVTAHPVVVAKQIATADSVSNGRIGLNIVAGWNKPEYEAMGLDLPQDHETRYAYAQEWFDWIKKLWTSKEAFDWKGKYFKGVNVHSDPKPQVQIPIFNAAGSGIGRDFAIQNANFLFTPCIDINRSKDEIKELKAKATAAGRSDLGVLTFSHVCCRPTEQEAKDYVKKTLDNADWPAVENLVNLQFQNAQSFPHDLLAQIKALMAIGHGGFPLTGTPTQVADGIQTLLEAGFSGTTLSFVNYVDECPYFRDNVLPILEQRGIRKAFKI